MYWLKGEKINWIIIMKNNNNNLNLRLTLYILNFFFFNLKSDFKMVTVSIKWEKKSPEKLYICACVYL